MFCTRCGKEYPEGATVCMGCGCPINTVNTVKNDSSAFGFGVLGFFVPVAGLILWLIWKDERPKRAKALGIGALVGVIVNVVWGIVAGIIVSVAFSAALSEIMIYGLSL